MASTPISVISSEYCVPNSVKIKIDSVKGVVYMNNEVIFRVEAPSSLHHRRVLQDVSGNPVLTLRKKRKSMHHRWQVFKGDGKDSTELLFSVKRSSSKINKKGIYLDVFLAENTEETVWDFKVNGGANKKSCDIYAHGSSAILAKMNSNGAFEADVDVYPNVDYAFIVALLTIVDQITKIEFGKIAKKAVKAVELIASVTLAALGIGEAMKGFDDDDDYNEGEKRDEENREDDENRKNDEEKRDDKK